MKIKIDKAKCSGCHLCEMVCSLSHLGLINTEKSAIRIHKDDLDTSRNLPVLCHQCEVMKCLDGEETIAKHERRKLIWNRERAGRCPFQALPVLGENAYHCHLCGGKPRCIKVCTPGAITLLK